METNSEHEADEAIPLNAFLIIEGVKVQPLTEAVINIGRRFENHVVIDDPRVSRQHAQLRAIHGHYVLFDLSSRSGTFVNGQRANQVVLYPGDEISLAGVKLIFSQNSPGLPDLIDTAPIGEAASAEGPTPTMDKSTVEIQAINDEPPKRGASAPPEGPGETNP